MGYDDVIERAAVALWHNEAVRAAPNVAKARNAETWRDVDPREQEKWLQQARAAAPILMEYGARLMREASVKVAEAGLWYALNEVADNDYNQGVRDVAKSIRTLDPAAIAQGGQT